MSDEFTRLGVNLATSSLGFTVQIVPPGRVVYRDASGEFVISTELFVKPLRLMLYRPKKEPERFDAVIPSVLRAIRVSREPCRSLGLQRSKSPRYLA